jgi:hypothetical protein
MRRTNANICRGGFQTRPYRRLSRAPRKNDAPAETEDWIAVRQGWIAAPCNDEDLEVWRVVADGRPPVTVRFPEPLNHRPSQQNDVLLQHLRTKKFQAPPFSRKTQS